MRRYFPFFIKSIIGITMAALLIVAASGFQKKSAADNEDKAYKGLKLFSDVLEMVQKNYVDDVNSEDLIHEAVKGMVESLDPHSSLLLPEDMEALQLDTEGKFTGVGIQITMQDGVVTVIAPIDDTPAHRAGLLAGDKIIEVNGTPAKDLRQAVKMIRGPKGTAVTLTIIRAGKKEPMDFDIVRDVIPIESVRSATLEPGYGYARITNFRERTADDLEENLDKLASEDNGLKGLVLDLRDNPGGLLNQSIDVSDIFINKGKLLSIQGRDGKNTKDFMAHPDEPLRQYPIVVLINGGSASASEIVAGALQDHRRAVIVGTTSFGKGSVQNVQPMQNGYGLKLTIARYYTPSGRSIQAKGIEPDIVIEKRNVPESDEAMEEGRNNITERDLEHHLEAEPNGQKKEQPKETDSETPPSPDKTESPEPSAEPEKTVSDILLEDNQVTQALQILKGFDILSGNGRTDG